MVNKSLSCENQKEFTVVTNDYQTVAVVHGRHMFVGVYRPPSGCFQTFSSYLERLLEFATVNKLQLTIGGDFNINMLENSNKKESLSSIIAMHGFDVILTTATRVTETSCTLLDYFVTNSEPSLFKAGVIAVDLSDHLPVCMFISAVT